MQAAAFLYNGPYNEKHPLPFGCDIPERVSIL